MICKEISSTRKVYSLIAVFLLLSTIPVVAVQVSSKSCQQTPSLFNEVESNLTPTTQKNDSRSELPTPMQSAQGSSGSYWQAPFPSSDALLNQTLTTYKHDTNAEIALSANLYKIEKDSPQPGQCEFELAIVASANSRYTMGYTVSYLSGNIYIYNSQTLSLGDNGGVWVNLPFWFPFYGAWYHKIFVTSNGLATFDQRAFNDDGGKWTSPNPRSIPSTDDPNGLIAPLWRDLDPSSGGSVKCGDGLYGSFVVLWENVPNKANGNTQTFALYLYPGFGDSYISFVYGSITSGVSTSVGIEDQAGKRGVTTSASSGSRVNLQPNSPDNFKCITQIRISASKLTDSGTNDNNAVIGIDGLDNTYPGGINVQLYNPSEGTYKSFPILSAATWTVSTIGLAAGVGFLGIVGCLMSGIDLAYELSQMSGSTLHEADRNTQTAYVSEVAQDENMPAYAPWDAAVTALFRWRILDPSLSHRLLISVQLTYGWPSGSYLLTTDNLELKMTPGSVSSYGRTNPDAHYYNFQQISTPYGTGYHIDTAGRSDLDYLFLGWCKLTDDALEDYKVGSDGKITVKGYFRQYDTFTPALQPGRRGLDIYLMYSDNLNAIVKVAHVLNHTEGTSWKYKEITIDGLAVDRPVKIGIGRGDRWQHDWSLTAEWMLTGVSSVVIPWAGITNPSGHFINFYDISTPYGIGHHIDTAGSNDHDYVFFGYSKVTGNPAEDYKVGSDGKVTVSGYFRQNDTLWLWLQPGRRVVDIYVMYSDNMSNIVKVVQVLDMTDGTDWKYRQVTIDGLTPGKAVKIGIGRGDWQVTDWELTAEWVAITVTSSG